MTGVARKLCVLMIAAVSVTPSQLKAEYRIDYSAEAIMTAGGGDFAPYYVASNNHGVVTQSGNALIRAALNRSMELDKRFSYGFGVDLVGGYGSDVDYLRYDMGNVVSNPQHPARVWIQQLYGEIRYRGVFLTAGLKEHGSALLYNPLTSGDLIESGNSRPIPEVRAGFIDFQNIPFTNGWLQIQGEISYGKFTDGQWLKNHYNYYDYHINLGALYTYKRCYFRTKPSMPFSATFGMQVGAQFGGTSTWFTSGVEGKKATFSRGIKQFFKMFLPTDGGLEYYSGSSLGSWDVVFRYRLKNGYTLRAYFQKPFEDGSGIGFLNGFDGLWGLEFRTHRSGIVSAVVAEYLDFTNQSGPLHWDPDDNPATDITNRAEGADNYYNNHEYNSYANYGMAIGTPFLPSPIYNRNGAILFLHNRVRGFHVGIEGNIVPKVAYRLMGGYRKSFGTPFFPSLSPMTDTSFMAEATWKSPVEG
nr:capsule assembly Wzi family protein [Muribaculaceae bacterium]